MKNQNSRANKPYIDSKKVESFLAPAPPAGEKHPGNAPPSQERSAAIEPLMQRTLERFRQEMQAILAGEPEAELLLPISIFCNKLSTLEAAVKFLHENKQLKFAKIAEMLQRDGRTIWHAYRRAQQRKVSLASKDSAFSVPASLFAERNYAPLEALVSYLREKQELSFSEISRLLKLSPKTVWTAYSRKKKKQSTKQNQSKKQNLSNVKEEKPKHGK